VYLFDCLFVYILTVISIRTYKSAFSSSCWSFSCTQWFCSATWSRSRSTELSKTLLSDVYCTQPCLLKQACYLC